MNAYQPSAEAEARRQQRDALQIRAQNETCACGREVGVAFYQGAYRLRCGRCGYGPETRLIPNQGLRARFRRGEPIGALENQTLWRQLNNELNAARCNGERPRPSTVRLFTMLCESMGEAAPPTLALLEGDMTQQPHALTTRGATELMTKEEAQRFVDLGGLPDDEAIRAAALALVQTTGLNPALGEFMVYEKKLYVTADGMRSLMQSTGEFDGVGPLPDGRQSPYFLTESEKRAEGYTDPDDIVIRIAVYRKGVRFPAVGTGKANAKNTWRQSAVEKNFPQRMAETRALRHAFRNGWQDSYKIVAARIAAARAGLPEGAAAYLSGPLDMPDEGTIVEGQARVIEDPAPAPAPPEPPPAHDPETGEILEGRPSPTLDMLVVCPVHGIEWQERTGPNGKFYSHPTGQMVPDGKGGEKEGYCNRNHALSEIMKQGREAAGMDDAEARLFVAERFHGKTPSGLSDQEKCDLIDLYRQVVEEKAEVAAQVEAATGGEQPADLPF